MKLSEMTTDKAAELIVEVSPLIDKLIDDELVSDLETVISFEGKTIGEIYAIGAKKISTILSIVIKNHRAELFGIIGMISGKTIEEVAEMKMKDTINEVKTFFNDFMDIVLSVKNTEKAEI